MKKRITAAGLLSLTLLSTFAHLQAASPDKYFGVIELGSKGIKAIVVEDKGRDASKAFIPPLMVEEFKPRNKNCYDGDTSDNVAKEVQGISKAMKEKYNMPLSQIYLVMSSGIPTAVKDRIDNKVTGIEVDRIDVATESRLVFQGIVPPNRLHKNEVVVLDIGSGNSKGAYIDPDGADNNTFVTFAFEKDAPSGTGTFAKEVAATKQNGESLKAVAERIAGEKLLGPLQSMIRNKPGLQNCSRLYLAGGLPYVMTTLLHPEKIGSIDPEDPTGKKTSDWVKLSSADINRFYEIATTNPAQLLSADGSKLRKEAADELDRVKGIFGQDELTAGAVLLKMFMDNMHAERKEGIFFSRRALFAWPQGYVKEKLAARP